MTKFIYDTKTIMVRAWAITDSIYYNIKNVKTPGTRIKKESRREIFPRALVAAWEEAKSAMAVAVAQDMVLVKSSSRAAKSPKGRYLELLSVAQRDGLNHGKSWYCGEREIEAMGMNPMHEGELVCYVYAH